MDLKSEFLILISGDLIKSTKMFTLRGTVLVIFEPIIELFVHEIWVISFVVHRLLTTEEND